MKKFKWIIISALLVLNSCKKAYELSNLNSGNEAIFTKLTKSETGIDFANELYENMKFNGLQYEYYYNGSGLAVVDFNNDGPRIFFLYPH